MLPLLLAACSLPRTVDSLAEHGPSPELGRPAWVRGAAWGGGWLVGGIGAIGAIVLLPVSYPLRLVASDELSDEARSDLLWWPATGGAALGHALVGAPLDSLDYIFWRGWRGGSASMAAAAAEDAPAANPASAESAAITP